MGPSENVGLGCMRLPSGRAEDAARAIEVLHAALTAGVRLLDTAHAYMGSHGRLGDNERLVRAALAVFEAADDVVVISKVGMRRPQGRWEPDGRRASLLKQAEASAEALGRPADVLLLHARDPASSPKTWARALVDVVDQGLARAVGVSNLRVIDLEALEGRMPIACVEQGMHRYDLSSVRAGVLDWCGARAIPLIAHTPLGGAAGVKRLHRDEVLCEVSATTGRAPIELALAWLATAGKRVVPIPGATRLETVRALGALATAWRDGRPPLAPDTIAALDEGVDGAALLRSPLLARRPSRAEKRVVMFMGLPGSGKSTRAAALEAEGHERLNRDREGGTLKRLADRLDKKLADGAARIVLDNTYVRRADRNRVVEAAFAHGAAIDCRHCVIDIDDALKSAALRLIRRYGQLPSPDELKALGKEDPHAFAPTALYRHERELEPPSLDEGFEHIIEEPWSFVWPGGDGALVLVDEASLHSDDKEASARVVDHLRHASRETSLAVLAWRPGDPEERAVEQVGEALAALGLEATIGVCVHPAGPPRCWCRKPLPGRALELMWRAGACPERTVLIGASAADRTLARRLGAELRTLQDLA
jgi:aryl-alcohol dehydrogenase-like predicted oxidoreductase/predicted kinase